MIINYNVSGSERKQLVAAIAEYTNEKPKYLGAPSFAYQVAGFTISVDGKVTIEDNNTAVSLIRFLREKGFQAEDPLAESTAEEGTEEFSATEFSGICFSMPRSIFTEQDIANLHSIVEAKGTLIRKALEVDALPIEVTEQKVSFPWLSGERSQEEIVAFEQFVCKLCEMARNQKRVTAKERETTNEKYAFRCFLLRLGFIGDEYKSARKVLLRNMTGSSAFKAVSLKEATVCE